MDLDFSIKMLFHSRNQVRFHFRKGLIKIDKHDYRDTCFWPSVAEIAFSKFDFLKYFLYTIDLVTPPQNGKGSGQLLFGQNNKDQIWIFQN